MGSIQVPTLSHQDTLLYLTLHAFRHLLRNDLRLSHLYEIGVFLHGSSRLDDFWEEFLAKVSQCPNTRRMVATTFELVRLLFSLIPSMPDWYFFCRHLTTF